MLNENQGQIQPEIPSHGIASTIKQPNLEHWTILVDFWFHCF